jgi:cell division protease FtsH
MKPRMLAASVRPIADVLVDSLRASGRFSRLRAGLPKETNHDYEAHQFSMKLEDESNDADEPGEPQILHPDEAAAAVLLGKAFEHSRQVLASLRQPDTLAIVEVPHPDFVEPINKILRAHVLGTEAPVLDGDDLGKRTNAASPGTVVVFESPEATTPRKTWPKGAEFAAAMQLRCAVIGITSDLALLPHDFVSLAEHRIVVPPLDGAAIGVVIEAVTGTRPSTQIEERLASRVSLEALSIAVRADLGPERSLGRLRRLLDARDRNEEGPLLSEMHGLGPAKQWGLDLAADLRAYVAGNLPWSACAKACCCPGRLGPERPRTPAHYPARPACILSRPAMRLGRVTRTATSAASRRQSAKRFLRRPPTGLA